MTTFLLGLSVGGGCLTHCGPVLLPILLCEGSRRWLLAIAFLAARLCGYALVALATYILGHLFGGVTNFVNGSLLEASLYLILGALLINYCRNAKKETCASHCSGKDNAEAFRRFRGGKIRFAARTGFLTGLGLCAPMMAIVAEGVRQGTLLGTVGAFLLFFLGTSAVLLPLFACGFACGGKTKAIREIGFLAGFVAAALYIFQGITLIIMEVTNGLTL